MPRISRNVKVLGLVSFFNDLSSEMLYPIIPVFLTEVLHAPMTVIGVIEGIAESTASLLKVVSGWASDRWQRRIPFIRGGYALSAVSRPILALAFSWPVVLVARFVDRLGKGIRTAARDALIADSTRRDRRGEAFGFHRALDTAGAVVGPLIALFFLRASGEAYRSLFLIAFLPAILGLFLLVLYVREKGAPRESRDSSVARHSLRNLDGKFRAFLLVSVIFAAGNSSDAFLILRAKDAGLSTAAVLLVYILFNISYALFSWPAGRLSDRLGRKGILIAGYLVFAVVYAAAAVTTTPPAFYGVIFVVYGLYTAMTEGVSKAMISDVARPEQVGTAMGAWQTATGLTTFFASLIAGLLWQHIGPHAPFLYGAGTAVFAAVLFRVLIREETSGP
jgi:MFS family permease